MIDKKENYENNPSVLYADIINLPHHQSDKHPHMSLYDRSAQFAPFAALTGYEDMISEEARETGVQRHLEDWEIECINQTLSKISDMIADGQNPSPSITYFVPDKSKGGGEYVTVTEKIKKIDTVYQKVVLMKTQGKGKLNIEIDIDRIIEIILLP